MVLRNTTNSNVLLAVYRLSVTMSVFNWQWQKGCWCWLCSNNSLQFLKENLYHWNWITTKWVWRNGQSSLNLRFYLSRLKCLVNIIPYWATCLAFPLFLFTVKKVIILVCNGQSTTDTCNEFIRQIDELDKTFVAIVNNGKLAVDPDVLYKVFFRWHVLRQRYSLSLKNRM